MPRKPKVNDQPSVLDQPVAPDPNEGVGALDSAITAALNAAAEAGVPKGFIVAVLHAHALKQTQLLLS
jgi:hypothetical protein